MVDHSEQELFLLFAFEQGQFRAGREILRTDQEGRQQLCEQLFSERLLGVLTERQQSGVEPDRFPAAVRVFNPAGEFRCPPGRVGVNRCVLFRGAGRKIGERNNPLDFRPLSRFCKRRREPAGEELFFPCGEIADDPGILSGIVDIEEIGNSQPL